MKKLCLFWIICGFVSFSHAEQDRFGATFPTIWRSSFTPVADSGVVALTTNNALVAISTGTIFFHGIVASDFVNGSTVTIMDNTMFGVTMTTVTSIYFVSPTLSTSAANYIVPQTINYDVYLSSGLMYQKLGAGNLNFLWDYHLIPHTR